MDEFRRIMEELLHYGSDKKELEFWEALYQDLSPEEQKKILGNLKLELEVYRKEKKN